MTSIIVHVCYLGFNQNGSNSSPLQNQLPQQTVPAQMPAQLSLTPTTPGNTNAQNAAQNATNIQKEFNILSLCRIGQETVQDIVSRFQEVFGILKNIQPPNGTTQMANNSAEKRAKCQEQFRTIRLLFKRLRLLYDKCNDTLHGVKMGVEFTPIESLIPLVDDEQQDFNSLQSNEEYKKAVMENRELSEIVMLRNKQLREIIDRIRIIIWEINTMMSLRKG